jgi:hypothetical protein
MTTPAGPRRGRRAEGKLGTDVIEALRLGKSNRLAAEYGAAAPSEISGRAGMSLTARQEEALTAQGQEGLLRDYGTVGAGRILEESGCRPRLRPREQPLGEG